MVISGGRLPALAVTLGLIVALSAPALADVEPKPPEKGPDAQGTGAPAEEEKNPLPEIVEKMKAVERRMAETDAGSWTQEQQKAIAEALEIETSVVDELQKLIDKIESQPP